MEALVGQEAQFVSNPVRKAEPVKSVTFSEAICKHREKKGVILVAI